MIGIPNPDMAVTISLHTLSFAIRRIGRFSPSYFEEAVGLYQNDSYDIGSGQEQGYSVQSTIFKDINI